MTPSRRTHAKKLAVGAFAAGSILITGLGAGAGLASAEPGHNPPSHQQQQCDPRHPAPGCPQQGPQGPNQGPWHQSPKPPAPPQHRPAPPQQHWPAPPEQHRPMPPRPPQHRPEPPRRWLHGVVRHNLRPFWYRGQWVRPTFHRGWGWGFNYGPFWVPIYLR